MHGWMEGGRDRGVTDNGWINGELDEGKERNSVRRRKGRTEGRKEKTWLKQLDGLMGG